MATSPNPTRRILWVLGGLVILVAILGIVGSTTGLFGGGEEGMAVEHTPAERRVITQVVTASGKVQPEVEVKISPDVSGEIIQLTVNEGDQVAQGQLLVRIRPDFYEAQVEQADANVLQSRASLAQRRADQLRAELDFERQQDLFEKNVISEADFQAAQTQLEVAKASYEAAEYAVQSASARLREAREQLGQTAIYAPMDGTVSKLDVELGERVVGTSQMSGTEMMRIAKLDQMEIMVDVNENDVVNVALGDSARIEIDAYPERTFRGVVTEIANSARAGTMQSTEQVTSFPVKVRILDPHNLQEGSAVEADPGVVAGQEVTLPMANFASFRPGMSGTIDVFTHTVFDVVAVPIQAVTVRDLNKVRADSTEAEETNAAIAVEDLRKVVFITDGTEARMLEVETGIADDTHIEIRSGLEGTEEVIIGPFRAVSRELEPGSTTRLDDEDATTSPEA
ncbi:MAG: efflux RND transporter periplasmic adaptor subunit [Bacteroidota bacterium]